jgi:hypothetical protein
MWLCTAGVAATPMVAMADGTLTPYAAEDIEHNSNVFDLPSNGPVPVGKHGPTFSDTFFEERVGLDALYVVDQQKFFGTAEFRHFDYDNFTSLDHNEELIDGGLIFKSSPLFDGTIEYKHQKSMVLFQQLSAATALIVETESNARAAFNVNITPEWRLESTLRDRVLDSPREEVPGLSLHEDAIREGLRYLGMTNLSAGVDVEYLEGKYQHDPTALDPKYHQVSALLAANYVISGLTNFNGSLGYTSRVDQGSSKLSGVTGSIGYRHSLTGKTSINVQLSRALSSYVTTGGNEIDTSASGSVTWQATYKLGVTAGYAYTISKYPDTPDGAIVVDRTDHFQSANIEAAYHILKWLSIRPYAKYMTRHSNVPINSFDSNIVGIELIAKQIRPNP